MTTLSVPVQRSGNVLDLNAYRRQREAALRSVPEEEAWLAWCDQTAPAAYSPRDTRSARHKPRLGEVMDVAASAAMVITALVMTAMVLL